MDDGANAALIAVGFWAGPLTNSTWPEANDFVDWSWDLDDRQFIADYLESGMVVRSFMGYSSCRFCGQNNGALEFSDGVFVWPEGLAHYVRTHGVRMPDRFVDHANQLIERLENADRDEAWWRAQPGPDSMG